MDFWKTKKPLEISGFIVVSSNSLQLIAQYHFPIEIVFDVLVLVIGGIISLRAKDNFQKRYWGAISFCIGLVFLWENAGWLTIVSETPAYRFSDLLNMEKMLK